MVVREQGQTVYTVECSSIAKVFGHLATLIHRLALIGMLGCSLVAHCSKSKMAAAKRGAILYN